MASTVRGWLPWNALYRPSLVCDFHRLLGGFHGLVFDFHILLAIWVASSIGRFVASTGWLLAYRGWSVASMG